MPRYIYDIETKQCILEEDYIKPSEGAKVEESVSVVEPKPKRRRRKKIEA